MKLFRLLGPLGKCDGDRAPLQGQCGDPDQGRELKLPWLPAKSVHERMATGVRRTVEAVEARAAPSAVARLYVSTLGPGSISALLGPVLDPLGGALSPPKVNGGPMATEPVGQPP